ncbi:uncharacterized protein FA14DRAFT_185457 [Meira miltonrushii]|uniref:F-box domain-containing protein n=1 Tax=Meira miltonrushii TaxID=1280837 RepID=A0A316VDF7_9BASI|nr:uncharacterized protein FA14DRAFT_185457 [Meira miltonrushii]PWN34021.1 hypothetical protein FA14DRAFT_185457 [Meira miltonrushii]
MILHAFTGEDKADNCVIERIEEIFTFNTNNFDAEEELFVPLLLSIVSDGYVKKVLDVIKSLHVEKLWILIGKKALCKSNHKKYNVTLERIRKVVEQVRETIIQCYSLTNLRIVCTIDVAMTNYKSDNCTQWPLYQCKLDEFTLHGIKFDTFFPEEVLSSILSKAGKIELWYDKKDDRVREEKAWQILTMARKTLVHGSIQCQVDLPFEGADSYPYKTKPCKNIHFPKLYELTLDIYDEDTEWETINEKPSKEVSISTRTCGEWRYSLDLPKIDHVGIFNSTPAYVLESLSDNHIKSLHLDVFTAESLRYLEATKLNFKLNRLVLGFAPAKTYFYKFPAKDATNKYASRFLKAAIISLSHVWLRTLDIYGLANDKGNDLVKLMAIREAYPMSTHIRFFHFIYCHKIAPHNFRWIKEHLEHYYCLGGNKDDSQLQSFMYDVTGRFICENYETL